MGIDSDSGDQADGDEASFRRICAREICNGVESLATTQLNCMPTTKRRAAVYGLESSDTSRTPVEEGAAVLASAPDLTVSMPVPVLAYKKASIDDVCIWSVVLVFELV